MNWPWWSPFGGAPEITPARLFRWIEAGRPVQLVDSRTALEYSQGTISRARHAPVTTLQEALEELSLDPEKPVVFLCLSGHRSRPGTRLLRSLGYEAYSLEGGILSWRRSGFPLEKPEGASAIHAPKQKQP
jgi:rhodanese-related sulfurtransferase